MSNLQTWIAIHDIVASSSDSLVLTASQHADLQQAIEDEKASTDVPNGVFLTLPIQIK